MTSAYLLNYFYHLGTAIALLAVFLGIYHRVTPYHELNLIANRNQAAAFSFGGAALGFSLTLVSAILNSATWTNFVVWAGAAGGVQIFTFLVLSLLMRNLARQIEDGNVATGIFVGSISVATGALNAACLT